MIDNTVTTKELNLLAQSDNAHVRKDVALHKNTSLDTLTLLTDDVHPVVRDAVLLNVSLMTGKLDDASKTGDAYMELSDLLDAYDAKMARKVINAPEAKQVFNLMEVEIPMGVMLEASEA